MIGATNCKAGDTMLIEREFLFERTKVLRMGNEAFGHDPLETISNTGVFCQRTSVSREPSSSIVEDLAP